MKIGIVQTIIGAGGGNDKVIEAIFSALEKTDHKVTIYTIGKPLIKIKFKNLIKIRNLLPIKLPIFGIYQRLLERFLVRITKGEDIILSLTGGELFIPVVKTQLVIFYSQNLSDAGFTKSPAPLKYEKGFWKIYYTPYKKIMARTKNKLKTYKNLKFIANSEYSKEILRKELNVEATVLYPPVETSKFKTEQKEPQVISVIRFSKEKNIHTMIQIMNKVNAKCVLLGSLTTANKPYFESTIKNKQDNIEIHKNEGDEQMVKLLAKSKVYLQTSKETFGIAVIEGIASGCIPIVPDNTANKETVPFNELRYVEDDNMIQNAVSKLEKAIKGDYDYLLPKLAEHYKKFDTKIFQEKLLMEINNGQSFNNNTSI